MKLFVTGTIYLILIFCVLVSSTAGQVKTVSDSVKKATIWREISSYFKVPAKYKGQFGKYNSPLKFLNGDTVLTVADWAKRRNEILDQWNNMMGKWPPLIKNQHFKILDSIRKNGFNQYRIKFFWLPNHETEGYLLVPDGNEKRPAVITVYYEPETAIGLNNQQLPYRDFAYQLVKRGFITLSIGTTETTNNKKYSLYYPDIEDAKIQPLSTLAYAAANAWEVLANYAAVDSNRIGIIGHSYGGKWAMFASCLFEKFACAVWSDPGIVFDESKESYINYWEPWYLGYYPPPWSNSWRKKGLIENAKGLYPKLIQNGHDLHELHALMAPRPFLVSGGYSDEKDRWIPLNWTVNVNQLLGYGNRVAMTNRKLHSPNKESNEVAFLFFEYFLK